MNFLHRRICSSDGWRKTVESRIIPWVLDGIELGPNVLEVGPGPGVTTDLLRQRVQRLTCVEIHSGFAESLAKRTSGQNVTVLCEDATAMSLADAGFDSAVCFTMLHHVPTQALQDRLLTEVRRVLRPGGVFAGVDSRYSRFFGLLHVFDTMTVVDPATFPRRLEAAGFVDVRVDLKERAFRFRARRPLA
jgi:ubiquinone/menaquinone biosynthesis C-methylase UbiE